MQLSSRSVRCHRGDGMSFERSVLGHVPGIGPVGRSVLTAKAASRARSSGTLAARKERYRASGLYHETRHICASLSKMGGWCEDESWAVFPGAVQSWAEVTGPLLGHGSNPKQEVSPAHRARPATVSTKNIIGNNMVFLICTDNRQHITISTWFKDSGR
ncbi:protein of unknown function [Acidithiobacillus ferrivorans]|uniref:Transposase n=1 Tax=Acidithiobacillus ferrivorans TaxID=160808 RepID=A0ABY1MR01_9PROT|nr:protein of unknown function [Acidithiobacillus ferrivorans]